jgi:hypothetical protein
VSAPPHSGAFDPHQLPVHTKTKLFFTQMVIFSHTEHILHNHFSIFHCGPGFFKFLTFSWWSLHNNGALLADGILGLIIEMTK